MTTRRQLLLGILAAPIVAALPAAAAAHVPHGFMQAMAAGRYAGLSPWQKRFVDHVLAHPGTNIRLVGARAIGKSWVAGVLRELMPDATIQDNGTNVGVVQRQDAGWNFELTEYVTLNDVLELQHRDALGRLYPGGGPPDQNALTAAYIAPAEPASVANHSISLLNA